MKHHIGSISIITVYVNLKIIIVNGNNVME